MISRDTVDRIIDASRIEEVVGDFVTLKKRGANLLGLCPFHNEKTPSFTVSPAKGIYKCFGCGAAGNSVNFIMQHESLSYPEALKYLARKYAIPVEEKEITPEEKAQQSERESLYIVAAYAQKYFSENMKNTDEGRSVGYGYFRERGFSDDTIEKFQLGYSSEARRSFSEAAVKAGYRPEYLVKTGLSIASDKHADPEHPEVIKPEQLFDRYSGRVIFPIHNVSGRVIGFGGRILNNDKKLAKYINSPQTDIYDKSKVLYGLYFAKKSITQEDNCFLVEGYTDVISMHQAGIENVVASSGTSLTVEQIRLIHRFTNNITILYDGDWAGIKASFRGIDLILEQGMNVRVLLFPDNEDPDSYSRRVSATELREFIKKNTTDFIRFKTNLLYEEAKNDPIKKAGLIKDIVESISLIPDAISRSVYVKECARLLDIEEQVLGLEMNKIRLKKDGARKPKREEEAQQLQQAQPVEEAAEETLVEQAEKLAQEISESQEAYILRLLLQYGDHIIEIEGEDEERNMLEMEVTVGEYVFYELKRDNVEFLNPVFQLFAEAYHHELLNEKIPDQKFFVHHSNPAVSQVAVNLISNEYKLSENWSRFGIHIEDEKFVLKKSVQHALFSLKEKRLMEHIRRKQEELKKAMTQEELEFAMLELKHLQVMKARVNKLLGRTIVK